MELNQCRCRGTAVNAIHAFPGAVFLMFFRVVLVGRSSMMLTLFKFFNRYERTILRSHSVASGGKTTVHQRRDQYENKELHVPSR